MQVGSMLASGDTDRPTHLQRDAFLEGVWLGIIS
jgi:hypothetical protein